MVSRLMASWGWEWKEMRGYKRAARGILVVMEMFCILTININTLFVILYYTSALCYHSTSSLYTYDSFLNYTLLTDNGLFPVFWY